MQEKHSKNKKNSQVSISSATCLHKEKKIDPFVENI